MPITPYERDQIARYKISIEGLRRDLDNLKERKKKSAESWAARIKSSSSADSKRSYRQHKIEESNNYVKQIEGKKKEIDRIKAMIAQLKK